jgi:heat-inducible transcriptional repressor
MSDNYMDARKQQLLQFVIEEYIATAEPVSSKLLTDITGLDVSGATIRNELRSLEDAGYLTHPHTSAGRIPTEKGYQYYVDHILVLATISQKSKEAIAALIASTPNRKDVLKIIAKHLAEHTGNAVMIAFDSASVYYTGMSQLFAQPEFREHAHTIQVSSIFDHCEEKIHLIDAAVKELQTHTYIGNQNPLGNACATVVSRLKENELLLCIAPTRMNYKHIMSYMTYLTQVL